MTVLAELPFPPEAIIPIVLVLAQLYAWYKANKEKQETKPSVFEPTWEEREIIIEQQARGYVEKPKPFIPEKKIIIPAVPPPLPTNPAIKEEQPLILQKAKKRRPSAQRKRLMKFLASPQAARDAILISEVLGPPISQRDSSPH